MGIPYIRWRHGHGHIIIYIYINRSRAATVTVSWGPKIPTIKDRSLNTGRGVYKALERGGGFKFYPLRRVGGKIFSHAEGRGAHQVLG